MIRRNKKKTWGEDSEKVIQKSPHGLKQDKNMAWLYLHILADYGQWNIQYNFYIKYLTCNFSLWLGVITSSSKFKKAP